MPPRVRVLTWSGALLFWAVLLALLLLARVPLTDALVLTILLVALPTFALAQLPFIEDTRIERLPAYWSSIATLWLVGTACWLAGSREGGGAAVGLVGLSLPALVVWSVGIMAAGLAVMVVFRQVAIATGARESAMLRELLPRTREEKRVFALLSVAAGVCEELAYRGYSIPVLAPLVGLPGAVAITSVVFGILHGYQGLMGTVRTTLMGGVLAWGFLASGSLLPAMVAHTLIDLVAGLVLAEWLLPPEAVAGVAPHSSETREA